MLSREKAEQILENAELIYSAETIAETVQRLADEITRQLSGQYPLVLCVMKGAVVFAGHLLPKLMFPLTFNYVQVSRYHNTTHGGALNWLMFPQDAVQGRAVLVIDDILDEGVTLVEVRKKILDCGARSFHSVVLANKNTGIPKPFQADFVGFELPNRYVFGYGMDVYSVWRNLPAIYALQSGSG
ncbi:hypoxanthine phosphoribosyltransferase [Nitrosomonas sp. Nm51]|uniref:hypoxanthine-guanine phosphoribosyltransferase n=1 Tax=Nitrosomonas sp. Nm51 TaxID=133720 RepID=UPI0008C40A72|nr:hypoxanthine-guanine phosphoribosyltransferase [Nitrosomonas sp. Nm51]SER80465.1 hypoxanthine phosphoribosyltransferase [Nitrosomonas sp. Nm51]